jgi:hypothetical protein
MSRILEALKQIEKRAPARPTRETIRSRRALAEPVPATMTPAVAPPATKPVAPVTAPAPWPSGVAEMDETPGPVTLVEPVAAVRPTPTRLIEGYYVHLRDTILSQNPSQSPLALLFARVGDVADASVVVAEFAVALASKTTGEILAVDADLGTQQHGSEGTLGFRDVLAGRVDWQECMTATATPRVRFMPAGAAPLANVQDDHWKNALLKLRGPFAHVLLDGGDVEGSHVPLLSRLAHSTYLLVELGRTARRDAQTAIRLIRRRGGKLGGCILTGAESHEVVAQLR